MTAVTFRKVFIVMSTMLESGGKKPRRLGMIQLYLVNSQSDTSSHIYIVSGIPANNNIIFKKGSAMRQDTQNSTVSRDLL